MDTIVIGAGAIGLGIAWRLTQRGGDVLVLDRDEPGRGASYHAAGMLAPITEAGYGEDALLRLNLASARRYPAFLDSLQAATGRRLASSAPGTLFVALDRDQLEALHRLSTFQQSLGLATTWLDGGRCRELEPALHPGVRAGILATEREVNPRALTAALAAAIQSGGGTIRAHAEVRRLVTGDDGDIAGVELAGGERITVGAGGRVVLAAGCWSGGIGGVPAEVAEAIRPVKGQILRLRPKAGEPTPIRHLIRSEEVYLVPRGDGELVAGATVEEQGFDQSLTGGGVYELLRAAIEAVPAVRELELVEASAGLRPGSRDNGPLIGPVRSAPGLLVASGHYRNGILLTPVTADAVVASIAGQDPPGEVRPFSPERFARRGEPGVAAEEAGAACGSR
ncbi:MAG TPA: glycine oxidase ThiO [Actinomycetota bacterium]|nr:glycine oxidase ThiO [Actinomycetota bacterium]